MAVDTLLVAVLFGLPLLGSDAVAVAAWTGVFAGAVLLLLGGWAIRDSRQHRDDTQQPPRFVAEAMDRAPSRYRGVRRKGRPRTPRRRRRLLVAATSLSDLNRRAVAESMRRLAAVGRWRTEKREEVGRG